MLAHWSGFAFFFQQAFGLVSIRCKHHTNGDTGAERSGSAKRINRLFRVPITRSCLNKRQLLERINLEQMIRQWFILLAVLTAMALEIYRHRTNN